MRRYHRLRASRTRRLAEFLALRLVCPDATWDHAPAGFDYAYARTNRVPLDGYLRFARSFYRAGRDRKAGSAFRPNRGALLVRSVPRSERF
jgi:hypothetical protein